MVNQKPTFRLPHLAALLVVFLVTAGGQTIKIRRVHAPTYATYTGYVRVFSHVAITVRAENNIYVLKTFSLSPRLREKYTNLHLQWGEKIKVYYRTRDNVALKIKAKWLAGS